MAQIRRGLRQDLKTQSKVLDILGRAHLIKSVIGQKNLAPPALIGDQPIIAKFYEFLNQQTVPLPRDHGKTFELLKKMKESVY